MRSLAVAFLILASTVGLVLVGDFTLGAVRGHASDEPRESCVVQDARLHHRWKPACRQRQTWGKLSYELAINSLGDRDASVRDVAPLRGGARRVVLIGDSYAVCCLPWQDLVVAKMQLRAPGMEFHTAGMLSWSPTIYARRVRELIDAKFEFDDLVVMIDISDIQDEAAVYGVDAKGELYDLQGRTRAEDTGQPNDALHDALQRLAASNKLRKWLPLTHDLIRSLAWREPRPGEIPDIDRGAWTYNGSDAAVEKRAYGPLGYAGGIAKAQAAMDDLAAAAKAAGIRLHLVVYPWPQQLLHDQADSLQVRVWRQWCERARCDSFVDIFPAMFEAKARSGAWYGEYFIPGDTHYNARGNDLIAGAIVAGALGLPAPVGRAP